MPIDQSEEDYFFDATIKADTITVEGVRCKLHLPPSHVDPISLSFHPTDEQAQLLEQIGWKFSAHAELDHGAGQVTTIDAEQVLNRGLSSKYTAGISESRLAGEPIFLEVTEGFGSVDPLQAEYEINGSFWLTPNHLLSPSQRVVKSYTGNINVKTDWSLGFTLPNGVGLTFTNHYRYQDDDAGTLTSFHELVAEFELKSKTIGYVDVRGEMVRDLEDLLTLASFASRHGCVWMGYAVTSAKGYTRYYRRDVSIPAPKKRRGDSLIAKKDIKDFLDVTCRKLVELGRNDLLIKAINFATPKEGQIFEGAFMALYSALETLVLYFRRGHNLEMIFSGEHEAWKSLEADLRLWLKQHPQLKDDKNKRTLLYQNLPALTRVSFRTAFQEFCNFYSINLDDLWPVVRSADGWSLAIIRNKLVHGEYFNRQQLRALVSAGEHLRWTVERMILSIFGWDVSRSRVSPDELHNRNQYKYWREDRKLLSS